MGKGERRRHVTASELARISPEEYCRLAMEAKKRVGIRLNTLITNVYMEKLGYDLNGQWWDIGGMDGATVAPAFFINGGRTLRNIEPIGLAEEFFHGVAQPLTRIAFGRSAHFEHATAQEMLRRLRAGELTPDHINMIEGLFLIKPVDDDPTLYKAVFELGRELATFGLHTIITMTDKDNYAEVARQGYKRRFKPEYVDNSTNSVIWRPNW